jgi:hypothetical protein
MNSAAGTLSMTGSAFATRRPMVAPRKDYGQVMHTLSRERAEHLLARLWAELWERISTGPRVVAGPRRRLGRPGLFPYDDLQRGLFDQVSKFRTTDAEAIWRGWGAEESNQVSLEGSAGDRLGAAPNAGCMIKELGSTSSQNVIDVDAPRKSETLSVNALNTGS